MLKQSLIAAAAASHLISASVAQSANPEALRGTVGAVLGAPAKRVFSSPTYGVPHSPGAVLATDIDGDGLLDLVAFCTNGAQNLRVLKGDGAGEFRAWRAVSVPFGGFALAAGRIDDGPTVDLFVGSNGSNQASVLFNNGLGGFDALPLANAGPTVCVAVADMDDDGDADLLLGQYQNMQVRIYWNDGAAGFSSSDEVTVESTRFAVGDLNQDHLPDIVGLAGGSVSRVLNQGSHHFSGREGLNVGGSDVAVGDLNGDGVADVAVADADGIGAVRVFLNPGSGSFGPFDDYSIGAGPARVLMANLTDDNKPEIVVASENGGTVTVLGNDGQGHFAPLRDDVSVGSEPVSLASGDFDRDGCTDLVVADYFANAAQNAGALVVLHNQLCAGAAACRSDLNGDGFVNTFDLVLFLADFGRDCAARNR